MSERINRRESYLALFDKAFGFEQTHAVPGSSNSMPRLPEILHDIVRAPSDWESQLRDLARLEPPRTRWQPLGAPETHALGLILARNAGAVCSAGDLALDLAAWWYESALRLNLDPRHPVCALKHWQAVLSPVMKTAERAQILMRLGARLPRVLQGWLHRPRTPDPVPSPAERNFALTCYREILARWLWPCLSAVGAGEALQFVLSAWICADYDDGVLTGGVRNLLSASRDDLHVLARSITIDTVDLMLTHLGPWEQQGVLRDNLLFLARQALQNPADLCHDSRKLDMIRAVSVRSA